MSSNEKLTLEELRFVYHMIVIGYNDADILNEYARLRDSGQLQFPLRSDNSFIKERRKEVEAASEVLQETIKKMIEPILIKRKEEHMAHLAEISASLLKNNLSTVRPGVDIDGAEQEYVILDSWNDRIKLDRGQLTALMRENVEAAYGLYSIVYFHQYFVPHLKAEMPDMETKGFWNVIEVAPYELIEKLKLLTKRKTFNGTCPVCQDW